MLGEDMEVERIGALGLLLKPFLVGVERGLWLALLVLLGDRCNPPGEEPEDTNPLFALTGDVAGV